MPAIPRSVASWGLFAFRDLRRLREPDLLTQLNGETMQVLTGARWAKFEAAIPAAEMRGARTRTEDSRMIEAYLELDKWGEVRV